MIIIIFFHSCVCQSTSTTKLSSDCHGRSLASTASHESRIHKFICLCFVSEKRIYAHVNKNNIIDPKRFAKNIDAQMITARDTANAQIALLFFRNVLSCRHVFPLKKG
jgi:hypothetical protein